MASITKLLEDMKESFLDDEETAGAKVIKTLPATKEEQKMWEEMQRKTDQAFALLKETTVDREKFWAKIQLRLDAFGENLSYNKKTKEIEFKQ